MTITAFQTNSETNLANMAADLLAFFGTDLDGATDSNENAQILTVMWALVKVIKARQHAAPHVAADAGKLGRDRLFELIGGHTANAFMALVNQIDEVYNEFYVAFNSVDQNLTNDDDEIWGTALGTRGPVGGPILGSPNYTAGLSP
jgi:hypothetical protein